MTDLEKLRLLIGDQIYQQIDNAVGNGVTVLFQLKFQNIQNASVKVNGTLTTAYTLEAKSGFIRFTAAPTDGHAIIIEYEYSAFTDTELTDILNDCGSVKSAALFCIDCLMADAARRFSYTRGASTMNVNEVFEQLKELKKTISEYSTPRLVQRTNRFYNKTMDDKTDLGRADLGGENDAVDISRI